MARPSKDGFPWIDGQFLNEHLPFSKDTRDASIPDCHIVAAYDSKDGEIRIRFRRFGSHAETNEVEIGISKDGFLTTVDHYDS